MNFVKSLLIITILAIPTIANSQPDDLDESNLERVGLKELQNISSIEFESGNYRLDPDFRLGYGDSVIIRLWGKLEGSYNLTIGRDGDVVMPLIGRVKLFGLTMDQADNAVMGAIDNRYSNVNFDINLADIKDIRVNILGYLQKPGPYAISPFCRVIEALAKAGGPDKNGSLCDVQIIRDGKVITTFNLYDFIRNNDQSQNIRLKHGDTVYIPEVKNLVSINGDIRYPGIYEIKDNSKLSNLFKLSGGMLPTKFKRKLLILRINPDNKLREVSSEIIFNPEKGLDKRDNIVLGDGDIIIISTELNYTPEPEPLYMSISLKGKFVIPGNYLVDDKGILSSLIKQAGGIKADGFTEGAVYQKKVVQKVQKSILDRLISTQKRAILEEEAYIIGTALTEEERLLRLKAIDLKKKALDLMVARIPDGRVVINLEDVLKGNIDIALSDGDILYIPPIPDWVLVSGAVNNSQSVFFKNGKDFNYYISITGGLTILADSENIYIIKANGSAESKSTGFGTISRGDIIIVPEKMN